MNLFVIARNFRAGPEHLAESLRAMRAIYPLLEPKTLQGFGDASLCAALMHSSPAAAAPRRYHHLEQGVFTLYDGCPVHPQGAFDAHDAAELNRRWDGLHEALEGQFFAARLSGERLELMSDPLGMHQTFCWQDGERLLVSNSVRLLSEVLGESDLDHEGASLLLGLGYAGGRRTLTRGVCIFPEGERWTLDASGLRRRAYFGMADLAASPRAAPGPSDIEVVALELGDALARLAERLGPLECPITAGRDSRILVALCAKRETDARYFSQGEDEHEDVRVGKAIARLLGLPHEQTGRGDDAAAAWDEASRRVVLQNDGLVTLAHVQNSLHEPEVLMNLDVHLYGAGGEYARGKWLTEPFVLAPQSARSAAAHAARFAFKNSALLTGAARAAVTQHLREETSRLLDAGFSPKALPCALFLHDYGRRWAGAQARQIASFKTVYMPFGTRPYVRSAFSLPPALRLAEHLPYRLLQHLSSALHTYPFAAPWRPQRPARLYAGYAWRFSQTASAKVSDRIQRALRLGAPAKAGRGRTRQLWLGAVLPELRGRYLDEPAAEVWQVLERSAFERLTAPETPGTLGAHAQGLFLALTLLEHERLRPLAPAHESAERIA